MSEEELLEFLKNRKGILEGVCITGGEPTLHPELVLLLKKIREMGYKIKLDTNGYRPAVLREVVEAGLVDYVAMDIKNAPADYGWTAGIENPDLKKLEESIQYLVAGSVDYEFRTTVVDLFHDEASVKALEEVLN
jgi:anaerobic ribonucleoside-triphosphate reductase activating protein